MFSHNAHKSLRTRVLCGVALIAMAEPMAAFAVEGIEEVVVTARKRTETLLEVPLSINVLTSQDIERRQIGNLADISAVTSGLTVKQNMSIGSNAGRVATGIAFRGAQTGNGSYARQNTGSLFIDGVYVSGSQSTIDTQDVERIEVLKGPQNAYFGRNTFAGAINFVTRNPGDTFQGSVDASGTTRGSYDVGASVEGPLVENKLSARLSGKLREHGADYRATDGGGLGEQSDKAINATLYATPSDNFWVRVRGRYQYSEDGPDTSSFLRGTLYGSLCPGQTFHGSNAAGQDVSFALSRPYFCGAIPSLADLQGRTSTRIVSSGTSLTPAIFTTIGRPNLFRDMLINNSLNVPLLASAPKLDHLGSVSKIYRLSGQSEYKFQDGTTVSLNLGYAHYDINNATDYDRSDADNILAINPQKLFDFSSEIRVTSPQNQRLRWLAGATYFKAVQEQQGLQYSINASPGLAIPTAGVVNAYAKDEGVVPAGFAAVDFDIFPRLTASAEIRYQQDKSTISGSTTSTTVKSNDWLPRFLVRYKFNDDSSIYASWAKGVMPGVPNTGYITATPSQQAEIRAAYPDASTIAPLPTTHAVEVGLKQRLFDGRVQYSLAAYHMTWDNINTAVTLPVTTSPFILSIIRAASATLKGIEFETDVAITDKWTTKFVLDLKDDKYKSYYNALVATLTSGTTYFAGNTPPLDTSVTGSLTTTYRDHLTSTWDWYVGGDVNYTGKQWESEANIGYFPGYWRVNARLGVEKDDLFIELFSRNLLNDKHWDSGVRQTSTAEPGSRLNVLYNGAVTTVQGLLVNPPTPREIGIRARYKF